MSDNVEVSEHSYVGEWLLLCQCILMSENGNLCGIQVGLKCSTLKSIFVPYNCP